MSQAMDGHDKAVETFANHTEMSEREAEAYVLREIRGVARGPAARQLDISESTLDNPVHNAKKKVRLPHSDQVKRVSARNTGYEEGEAIEIWFENQSMLRYVWNDERGEIREETIAATDPHSIHESFGVGGSEDELDEFALESIIEYTRNYRDDVEACRRDWSSVFEAIVCWSA